MAIEKLVYLKVLNLSNCYKITDAGFIPSIDHNDTEGVLHENTSIDDSLTKSINNELKISLGSRAEQEIILEAKKIEDVKKYYKHIESGLDPVNLFIRLKGLVELDLSGCTEITDLSLQYAFAFSELQILDFTGCHQVRLLVINATYDLKD